MLSILGAVVGGVDSDTSRSNGSLPLVADERGDEE